MLKTDPSNENLTESDGFEAMVASNAVLSEARDYGVDLWMLWANLHRPAEERLRRHQMALNLFHSLYNTAKYE